MSASPQSNSSGFMVLPTYEASIQARREGQPKREGNVYQAEYCTIADNSGVYDFKIDNNGEIVTVFGRVCLQFHEQIDEEIEGNERYRKLWTDTVFTQKWSTRQKIFVSKPGTAIHVDAIVYVKFFYKFPDVPMIEIQLDELLRECSRNGDVPEKEYTINSFFKNKGGVKILNEADSTCLLIFRHHFGDNC